MKIKFPRSMLVVLTFYTYFEVWKNCNKNVDVKWNQKLGSVSVRDRMRISLILFYITWVESKKKIEGAVSCLCIGAPGPLLALLLFKRSVMTCYCNLLNFHQSITLPILHANIYQYEIRFRKAWCNVWNLKRQKSISMEGLRKRKHIWKWGIWFPWIHHTK